MLLNIFSVSWRRAPWCAGLSSGTAGFAARKLKYSAGKAENSNGAWLLSSTIIK